jgi:hypothetical protein
VSESRSFGHMGVQYGPDVQVACATYAYDPPILSIRAGGCTVDVSARGRYEAAEHALKFARDLVKAATTYRDEWERLATAFPAGNGKAGEAA